MSRNMANSPFLETLLGTDPATFDRSAFPGFFDSIQSGLLNFNRQVILGLGILGIIKREPAVGIDEAFGAYF